MGQVTNKQSLQQIPSLLLTNLQSARFGVYLNHDCALSATQIATWTIANVKKVSETSYSCEIRTSEHFGKYLSVDSNLANVIVSDEPFQWTVETTETPNQVYIVVEASDMSSKRYLGCDPEHNCKIMSGGLGQGRRWNMKVSQVQQRRVNEQTFTCPYENCKQSGLTEDELVQHCPRFHYNENRKMVCPICVHYKRGEYKNPQGVKGWGYHVHLHEEHGPVYRERQAQTKDERRRRHAAELAPTYCFALVVVQHPTTKKFLIVEECCNQGYWLPGGRVDPGETFQEAAIRETIEEAGCKVNLTGIIRVEYSPFASGGARQRIIFYGVPEDPNAPVKSIPDYESVRAVWMSFDEMMDLTQARKIKLRGPEPYTFFKYVNDGNPIHPMSLLTLEGE